MEFEEVVLGCALKKSFMVWNAVEDGTHVDSEIVGPGQGSANLRPGLPLRRSDRTSANRVQAGVADSAGVVVIVQHNGGEAALKQMTHPPSTGVDEVGMAPMGLANSKARTIGMGRHEDEDEVDMVGHKAVRPPLDTSATCSASRSC